MSERSAFLRKMGYGLAIAALLFPISWLARPGVANREVGGKLAQLRADNNLSQGNLGEIDPASETIKLATLGLRGVAVNLLWERADYYKKTEDWTNLTATLEQLARLQPNFITFWRHQAWNLSYNVSVEFDDFRDRYYYVRRGIDFLQEGETYNRDNPQILWELGWFVGQKIGRADERVQYRRLFKADDEAHPADLPPDQRDNWLVSKQWYLESVDAADNKGRGIGRKSPLIFYSSPAKSQINYADAIEAEGFFDTALRAWKTGYDEWVDFGQRTIEHSTGVPLTLEGVGELTERAAELGDALKELDPELIDRVLDEAESRLSDEQRAAMRKAPQERNQQEMELAYQGEQVLEVSDRALAEQIGKEHPDKRVAALRLAAQGEAVQEKLRFTEAYKSTSNYDYWKLRAEFEQTPDAVEARKLMYRAAKAYEEADPFLAKELYEKGFVHWRAVLDAYPKLSEPDGTTGDDIMVFVKEYADVLEQLDEGIAHDFPLWDVIRDFDPDRQFAQVYQQHLEWEQQHGGGDAPKSPTDEGASKPEEGAKPEDSAQPEGDGESSPAAEEAPADDTAPASGETEPAEGAEETEPAEEASETEPAGVTEEPNATGDSKAAESGASGEAGASAP